MNDNYGYELIKVSKTEPIFYDLFSFQITGTPDDRILVGHNFFDSNGNLIEYMPVLCIENDLWLFLNEDKNG